MICTHMLVVSSLMMFVDDHPKVFANVPDAIGWFVERAMQSNPDDLSYIAGSIECFTMDKFLEMVNRGWLDGFSELYIYNLNINDNEQIQEISFPIR